MVDRRRSGRAAVVVACVAGLLHGASSLYWALGGGWLLGTVGEWAVTAVEQSPLGARLALGTIGLVKVIAAVIPVGVAWGRVPWPRFWRVICWIGGVVLVVYGAINVVIGGAVLLGVIRPEGGYDAAAMIGHVFLWDPLFLVWGAALIVWLRRSAARA